MKAMEQLLVKLSSFIVWMEIVNMSKVLTWTFQDMVMLPLEFLEALQGIHYELI